MERKNIFYLIFVFFSITNLYSQSFMEIIENNDLSIGNEISEYDYYRTLQESTKRYASLTKNNQIDELIKLKIDNILIDININYDKIITRISSEDANIIGPKNLRIGDNIKSVYYITNVFYYNNSYLGLYAKIDNNWIIVFGENDNIRMQNLAVGHINNDGVFVVKKQKPDSLNLNISEFESLTIKYFVYQNLSENDIYYTKIVFK
jgi:hypothetical protein